MIDEIQRALLIKLFQSDNFSLGGTYNLKKIETAHHDNILSLYSFSDERVGSLTSVWPEMLVRRE